MKKTIGFFFFFLILPFTVLAQEAHGVIQPNEGLSMHSIMRGVLGMVVLLALAYAFSSNRKAIRWKTVGIGLTFQLLIAIGDTRVRGSPARCAGAPSPDGGKKSCDSWQISDVFSDRMSH